MITIFTIVAGGMMGSMTNLSPQVQQMIPISSMVGQASMGILMGVFSIIMLPIVYGISGIISAFIYNFLAGAISEVEIELGKGE